MYVIGVAPSLLNSVMRLALCAYACRNQIDGIPKVIPQVHDDWFRSAADDNPPEWDVVRRVDLLVRKPCGNEQEITGPCRCVKLTSVTPANIGCATQNIRDRMLLS